MMSEERNFSQGSNGNPRNRGGGNRGRGNYGSGGRPTGGRPQRGGHRGPMKRPLLTSSTNALGFALMGLFFLNGVDFRTHQLLAVAAVCFGLSALISYVAQRLKGGLFEKISDLFFIAGTAIFILIAVSFGGLLSL